MTTQIRNVFEGRVIRVNVERVDLPNGATAELEVIHHPGGAAVVAIDAQQRICLLRQYRHAAGGWIWELPAGKIDNREPPLSTAQTFTVTVLESNRPPVVAPVPELLVMKGRSLAYTNTATDPDLPAQVLSFALDANAPAGTAIDPTNGLFTWIPALDQGPSTNQITLLVTDDGSPALTSSGCPFRPGSSSSGSRSGSGSPTSSTRSRKRTGSTAASGMRMRVPRST